MMKIYIGLLLFISNYAGAQNINGKWRGEFTIKDTVKVPFNFEIDKYNAVTLINGAERFLTGKAIIKGDSLFIPFDEFDNELALKLNGKRMQGVLRKQDGPGLADLIAEKGVRYRFKETSSKPLRNYSGKYEVVFKQENGKEEVAVGLFEQKGKKLIATFLKPSGDTRYQEGIIEGNKFYLSSFIGSTPGYYYGEFNSDGFSGGQIGTKSFQLITGKLNPDARLPDAYSLGSVKDSLFNFSLPDVDGRLISLSDDRFKNKVVVIAITGTWCPNCIDEARFLSPWYEKNKDRGIEIIAVHFERSDDTAYARKMMTRYKERFNIEYTQLFGGTTSREDIMKALPALDNFRAFPTTIFIDKSGRAVKVHTGFSGPATGKYYDAFIKEFNEEIDKILN